MLGVAILIIVMSVMNGFRTELTNKILGFNPHLIIKPYNQKNIDLKFRNQLSKNFPSIEVLESYSGEGVVINNDYAKGIMIKGLDPKNEKNLIFLNKILIEGKKNKIKKAHQVGRLLLLAYLYFNSRNHFCIQPPDLPFLQYTH